MDQSLWILRQGECFGHSFSRGVAPHQILFSSSTLFQQAFGRFPGYRDIMGTRFGHPFKGIEKIQVSVSCANIRERPRDRHHASTTPDAAFDHRPLDSRVFNVANG
jgi:hypothetical protein